jgi:hypothetical protein
MSARLRFQLAVDDAGEYLVLEGEELTIGHAKNRAADLPILADLLERHASLRFRAQSFHGGAGWEIAPTPELDAAGRAIRVNGVAVRGARTLKGGDRIEFSPQFAIRFHAPDPASSSSVLELERGFECLGAQRVLLLSPGPGGRVRIGRRSRDHVRVARATPEIELELESSALRFASETPLSLERGAASVQQRIVHPVQSRAALSVSRASAAEPPFVITVAPID